jgi:hypothetical protein
MPANKRLQPTLAKPRAAEARRSADNSMLRLLFVLMTVCLSLPGVTSACSCVSSSGNDRDEITAAYDNADLVILGRILTARMATLEEVGPAQEIQKTSVQVLRQWKGKKQNRVEFQIDVQCCICGYQFPNHGEFLIYAYGPDKEGNYRTTICNRTKPSSSASAEFEILDSVVAAHTLPNKTMEPTR